MMKSWDLFAVFFKVLGTTLCEVRIRNITYALEKMDLPPYVILAAGSEAHKFVIESTTLGKSTFFNDSQSWPTRPSDCSGLLSRANAHFYRIV